MVRLPNGRTSTRDVHALKAIAQAEAKQTRQNTRDGEMFLMTAEYIREGLSYGEGLAKCERELDLHEDRNGLSKAKAGREPPLFGRLDCFFVQAMERID